MATESALTGVDVLTHSERIDFDWRSLYPRPSLPELGIWQQEDGPSIGVTLRASISAGRRKAQLRAALERVSKMSYGGSAASGVIDSALALAAGMLVDARLGPARVDAYAMSAALRASAGERCLLLFSTLELAEAAHSRACQLLRVVGVPSWIQPFGMKSPELFEHLQSKHCEPVCFAAMTDAIIADLFARRRPSRAYTEAGLTDWICIDRPLDWMFDNAAFIHKITALSKQSDRDGSRLDTDDLQEVRRLVQLEATPIRTDGRFWEISTDIELVESFARKFEHTMAQRGRGAGPAAGDRSIAIENARRAASAAEFIYREEEHYVVVGREIQELDHETGEILPESRSRIFGDLKNALCVKHGLKPDIGAPIVAQTTPRIFLQSSACWCGISEGLQDFKSLVRKWYRKPVARIKRPHKERFAGRTYSLLELYGEGSARLRRISTEATNQLKSGNDLIIVNLARESAFLAQRLKEAGLAREPDFVCDQPNRAQIEGHLLQAREQCLVLARPGLDVLPFVESPNGVGEFRRRPLRIIFVDVPRTYQQMFHAMSDTLAHTPKKWLSHISSSDVVFIDSETRQRTNDVRHRFGIATRDAIQDPAFSGSVAMYYFRYDKERAAFLAAQFPILDAMGEANSGDLEARASVDRSGDWRDILNAVCFAGFEIWLAAHTPRDDRRLTAKDTARIRSRLKHRIGIELHFIDNTLASRLLNHVWTEILSHLQAKADIVGEARWMTIVGAVCRFTLDQQNAGFHQQAQTRLLRFAHTNRLNLNALPQHEEAKRLAKQLADEAAAATKVRSLSILRTLASVEFQPDRDAQSTDASDRVIDLDISPTS